MLRVVLQEEFKANNDPVTGSRSWRACRYKACGGRCKGHAKSCSLNFVLDWYEERLFMARGRSKKNTPQFSTEFVRCELTSEDKKHFADWVKKPPIPFDDLVNEVLDSNYKISLSYSEHNNSFICSVTGKPEDCDNSGKCYTSHAKDYITSMWVALYKFHVIWQKGVWESSGSEADFG